MNLAKSKLNKILLMQIKYWLVLLIINMSLDVIALDILPQHNIKATRIIQDSLVIKKNNSKRTCIVNKNQKIKIWVGDQTEKGSFYNIRNDTMSINKNGEIIRYSINDIRKIKVYGNLARNIIGGGFKIWGGAIFVAAFIPILDVGPAGLIISIPSWLVAFGIYKVGDFLDGNKTFNLEEKWHINEFKKQ